MKNSFKPQCARWAITGKLAGHCRLTTLTKSTKLNY